MPDWLFEFINPWTTPFTVTAAIIGFSWVCRIRGRWLAAIAVTTAVTLVLWQAWRSGPPSGLLDLKIYTNSARAWLDGNSIYSYHDPVFNLSSTYPPIGPLLFALLTPFTADGREVIFTIVSLAALFGCAWSVSGLASIPEGRRLEWSAWAFTAACLTIPVWLTFRQGQINAIIWLLVLVDLEALRRSRAWSGVGMGIATALKLLPGLFIVWLAITKRWASTLRAIAALVAVTAIGWVLAPQDSRIYWTDLLWQPDRVGSVGDPRNNSILSITARLFDEGPVRTAVWMTCVIALLAVALIRSSRASRSADYLAVAAIIGCASAAISPISWTHHLGFLLVALVAFAIAARTTKEKVFCVLVYLFLVDPSGHGDDAVFSSIRALLVVGAVLFTPIRDCTSGQGEELAQTETTPSSRETNSSLPC